MVHDKVENLKNYSELEKFLPSLEKTMKNPEILELGTNILDEENLKANKFSVICGTNKPFYESHEMYTDIHFLIKGKEKIRYISEDISDMPLDEKNDTRISYDTYEHYKELDLKKGEFCIFFPGEPHSTGNIADKSDVNVEKIVFKLKM